MIALKPLYYVITPTAGSKTASCAMVIHAPTTIWPGEFIEVALLYDAPNKQVCPPALLQCPKCMEVDSLTVITDP